MLTMRRMELISLHMDESNYLYLKYLQQIVEQHSIEDRVVPHADFMTTTAGRRFAPLCFTQVCLPFIRLLYLLGNEFKDLIYESTFQESVNRLETLITKWMETPKDHDSTLASALCFRSCKKR
ncbi:hypothetical protein JG687_00019393 [Phytophthora cactorum]|uniref:Uncharacterized protein n=1 Tax=Phytophthora cactorum TaxID=29920 RepID=A0A8T1TM86_9STRA|nr:hypothetical protein JG687_00019393 [Phytophthora cactorum]